MKTLAIAILSMLATHLFAAEIEFHGAAWNDLSTALGITPYYVEVNSDQTAKTVGLVLEFYKDGKLSRTIRSSPGGFDKETRLDPKFALYFVPKADASQGYTLTCAQSWERSAGKSQFDVALSDFPLGSCGTAQFGGPIKDSKKIPLFCVIVADPLPAAHTIEMEETAEKTVEANPHATVLIVSLERQ